MDASSFPLSGTTVVSLEQAVAAPLATRHLGDLGARVIKVERPGAGDFARRYDERARGLSSHFLWLNRGKESIELDVKDPDDAELLWRMLERADVFVQNLAPGAVRRLGLAPEVVRGRFPSLIYCTVTGYGESGPDASRKAYDLLIQADAGLLSITGTEDEPVKAGIPIADIAAGMYAYSGILTALLDRERTGIGSTLDVTMLDALLEWMGYPLAYALIDGNGPARTGPRHAAICPYGPFNSSDGRRVFLAVQNEREWVAFCRSVLERPELAGDPRFKCNSLRTQHRELLEGLLDHILGLLDADDLIARLDQAGIANARMRSIAEVLSHPQLTARGRWRDVQTPVGPLPVLLPPVSSDRHRPRMGSVPTLGADNVWLRHEFGPRDAGNGD
jgi:itaconate CoA-transferase